LIDKVILYEPPPTSGSGLKQEADGLLLADTENVSHDPFETTDEVKALTQEIIKTIRDIIVRIFCRPFQQSPFSGTTIFSRTTLSRMTRQKLHLSEH
jgi:hypothetical protein